MFLRHAASVMLALTIAACGDRISDPLAAPEATQSLALARAEAQWNGANVHDYAFDMVFRGAWIADEMHIEVRADTVTTAVSYRTNKPTGLRVTIPDLFRGIRQGIEQGSDVHVSYTQQYGLPVVIDVPNPPNWADADWGARIENFRLR